MTCLDGPFMLVTMALSCFAAAHGHRLGVALKLCCIVCGFKWDAGGL